MTERITVTVDNAVTPEIRAEIDAALLAHARSVIERLARGIAGYAADNTMALSLKMARDMFPEVNLTRETWYALGAGGTAYAMRPGPDRDRLLAEWRGEVPVQPTLPDMPSPPSPPSPVDIDDDEDGGDEDDDDACQHDAYQDIRCRDCNGRPDMLCEHNHSCQDCDHCESEDHDCRHCGLEVDCRHTWDAVCDDCGSELEDITV